ncbi:lipase 3 precursor [Aulographum hederae CBS 113979]|uniref:Carboxylic ester hydrolase n=1 Tax=Aulographum hederae CBS 113979 TaxID=1176131 RepID=A0A6G1H5B2_9PEZI|nr:lipase 3 precursor [Aulographum hederae CBS 113979]
MLLFSLAPLFVVLATATPTPAQNDIFEKHQYAVRQATGSAAPGPTPTLGPVVKIKDGTINGWVFGRVEGFNGVPYAEPPIGNLRLKPPVSLTKPFGTITATGIPTSCPQMFASTGVGEDISKFLGNFLTLNPISQILKVGEDCLTMSVQRPQGTKAGDKLPVAFWIYGGGFELGSTGQYNGAHFVNRSMQLGKPTIFVQVNYRVSGFGFLAGKELAKEGSTNLGLRDQRMGLQWTQDNIEAFGGDPEKVTVWGESAGAISTFDQIIINGGDHTYKGKPMFRGAIMNSGSIVPAVPVDHPKPQAIFDTVAKAAGCGIALDKLACLRRVPFAPLQRAVNSVPGIFSYSSLNLAYLPRPDPNDNFFSESPEKAGLTGKVAKVPIIVGDLEDEGTLFALVQSNITNSAQLHTYVKSYFPLANDKVISGLLDVYPETPSAGSPFDSGNKYTVYPQFKRLAAILGDLTFILTRRIYLDAAESVAKIPTWSYLSSHLKDTSPLGTFHGSDLIYMFGLLNKTSHPGQTSLQYFISFVNDLDPNSIPQEPKWPQYDTQTRPMLHLHMQSNNLTTDTFRQPVADYLEKNIDVFKV